MISMRRFHRWFSIIAVIFFIVIAVTGIGMQIDSWLNPPPSTLEVGMISGAGDSPQVIATGNAVLPKEISENEGINWHYLLQDIHSGAMFGTVGKIVNAICGIILLILSFTGAYVYYDMFRNRKKNGKGKLFWK